jgi:outer membrane protein insertion porin family
LLPCFCRHAAWALEPFKVQDIRVEGLQRVEPGTVFASMPLRVGDDYNDEKARRDPCAVCPGPVQGRAPGSRGNVLVVVVEERPTIADVNFAGTKEFDKDTLKKAMRDVGLTEGRPSTRRWPTAPSRSSSASTSTAACMAPRW